MDLVEEDSVTKYVETGDPHFLYQRLEVLGIGSFGKVFKSLNLVTREVVALKVVNLETLATHTLLSDLRNEIMILARCQCPNIVSYHCSFVTGNEVLVSMEYMDGGTITDLLRPGRFPDPHVRVVLREVLLGLAYLHHNGIIHRDLKPRNIMVSSTGDIKLADFGVAAQLSSPREVRHSLVGTALYMAPEVILESDYSFEADIWSLGILAYELATGNAPNEQLSAMDAMTSTVYLSPPRLPGGIFEPDLEDFVAVCLNKNKDMRPTAFDLLGHPALQLSYGSEILIELVDEFQQWKMAHQQGATAHQHQQADQEKQQLQQQALAYFADPFWDFDEPAVVRPPTDPAPTTPPKKSKKKSSATSTPSSKSKENSADDLVPPKRKRKSSLAASQRLSEDDLKQEKKKKKRISTSQADLTSSSQKPKSRRKSTTQENLTPSPDPSLLINTSIMSVASSHLEQPLDASGEATKKRKKKKRTQDAATTELAPDSAEVVPRPRKTPKEKRKSRSKSMIQDATSSSSPDKEAYRVSSPDVGGSMVRISEDVPEHELAYEPFSQRRRTTLSSASIPEFDEQGRRLSRASISYQARRERELSFVEGDILKILPSAADENGAWVQAELDGKIGLVPAFVVRSHSLDNLQDLTTKPKKVGPKKSFEELLAEVPESRPPPPPQKPRKRWSMVETFRHIFSRA